MQADHGPSEASIDLREYLGILRARKWAIILVALLTVAAAMAASYWQTPLYTGEARVLVNPLGATEPETTVPTVDVATESEVMRSEPVAALVKEDLGLDTPVRDLVDEVDIEAVTESRVLQVSYTATTATVAANVANSFAENYLAYRREQVLQELEALRSAVETRIASTSEQLADVTAQLDEAERQKDPTLVATLEGSRNALHARLGILQQELEELNPQENVIGGGDVIDSADVPSSPSSPNYLRNGLLATFLGVALGIGLAFLRERLDDRFRGRADVERTIEAPVLASVPVFRHKKRRGRPPQIAVTAEPRGFASESYRTLRTNLQYAVLQRNLKSIVITSASSAEGKTSTAVNLAVVLAQAGRRVILISADLRKPSLEKYFGIDRSEGLSTWLLEPDLEIWSVLVDPGIPNLRVIPSGRVPGNPAELLTSPRMNELITTLEGSCDVVLIDSPPVLPIADAGILSSKAGGVILVIDAGKTHRSAAANARREIERGGGIVVGCVLNAIDPGSSPYYRYESPYRYYYASPDINTTGDQDEGADRRGRRRLASR